jgi:hypothetical protein
MSARRIWTRKMEVLGAQYRAILLTGDGIFAADELDHALAGLRRFLAISSKTGASTAASCGK